MMQLSAVQARVVASLVEKDRTTPDSYPLTTNSLVAACNQKTSRDPVMALTAAEIDAALLELRQMGMVRTVRGQGERTFKHRHTLDEALDLDHRELACIAILALRGAQTPGELRTRSERYVTFADVAEVETTLRGLAGRHDPLVRNLGRGPGQSQDRWIELMSVGPGDATSTVPTVPVQTPGEPADSVGSSDAVAGPGELDLLRAEVQRLGRIVEEIREELGMTDTGEPGGDDRSS